ncbi:unnamed protein product [Nesidiocoris tenuis]|uniref:Transcription initiation factor TFIID subunit 10 n=1 Tax=Nesidiocoris tenuis TaxID=355587 RepID=A0A6H5GE83_9HEMI|nr:unnamed protein product [Nesidiocoris tenuis]
MFYWLEIYIFPSPDERKKNFLLVAGIFQIPDAVLLNLMTTAGIASTDPTTTRLISLAAQKFLSGVAYDALQHCKVRTSNQSSKSHHGQSANHNGSNHSSNHRQERRTLTMDDLTPALAERGIAIRKPPYYE